MAIVKTARVLQASATNAAGATTTGSAIDLTTAFGLGGVARITNGATGPTIGCTFTVEVSNDSVTWRKLFSVTASVAANAVKDIPFSISEEFMYARAIFSGNTGQSVTVECVGHELTSI